MSDSPRPRVVVLLVHHDEPEQTLRSVSAIGSGSHGPDGIVVVTSQDRQDRRLARALRGTSLVVHAGSNVGYAAANNIGLRLAFAQADADFVWILNPDALPQPGAFDALLKAAESSPDALLIGSRIVRAANRQPGVEFSGATFDPVHARLHPIAPECRDPQDCAVTGTDVVMGCSMLVRRSGWEQVGPMPEEYFLYFEEYDWALRARTRGWRVVVAHDSVVSHRGPWRHGLPSPTFVYYMTRNRVLFLQRWGGVRARESAGMEAERMRNRIASRFPPGAALATRLIGAALSDADNGRWGRTPEVERIRWPRSPRPLASWIRHPR